jgi:hypothetical protein
MFWEDKFEIFRVVDSIENRENCATRVTDYVRSAMPRAWGLKRPTDMFHALSEHHFVKYFASSFPNEAVRPVSIQRRSGGDI